jgi:hypothetical protein
VFIAVFKTSLTIYACTLSISAHVTAIIIMPIMDALKGLVAILIKANAL